MCEFTSFKNAYFQHKITYQKQLKSYVKSLKIQGKNGEKTKAKALKLKLITSYHFPYILTWYFFKIPTLLPLNTFISNYLIPHKTLNYPINP